MTSTVAERIRHLFDTVRRPDGKAWTLQEVARGTGLSISYVWRLRSGRAVNPTRSVLERLASFFGVPVSFLISDDYLPSLADRDPAPPAPAVERLLEDVGDLFARDDLDQAERIARKAIADARASADPLLAGKGLLVLAKILVSKGQIEEAQRAAAHALRLLGGPKAGSIWLRAVTVLSHIEYLREHFSHAYFHARRALAAIELGEGDDDLRLQVLYRAGMVARRVGRLEEAIACLEQAQPLAERRGEKFLAANLLALGLAYLDADQAEASLECFQRALTIYVRIRMPNGAAKAQHNIGLAYEKLGRWQEAIESLTKSLGSNEALGDLRIILYDHMELGWCYANIGQRETALRHAHAALALAQEHDWPGDLARAHWHLGRVLTALGETEEAVSHYQKATQLLENLEIEAELPRVQLEFGDLLMKQGDVGRAAELFRKAAVTLMHAPSLQRYLLATPPAEISETELLLEWKH